MMNIVSLGLLASVLAAAGLFSPPLPPADPKSQYHHQDALVREGHRVIVVEYERQLPMDDHQPPSADHHLIQGAKDKFQEAASLLPNIGQGISTPLSTTTQDDGGATTAGVKEKICDAFGHCRDKLSTLLGTGKDAMHKGKDALSEKTSELEQGAKDAIDRGKEKLSDAASETKDMISDTASRLKDAVGESKEKLSDKASDLKESAKDAADKTMEKLSDKASHLKDAARSAVDKAVGAGEDIAENTSEVAKTVENADAADLRRNFTDIARRARDVAYDAASYVASRETARAAAAVAQVTAVAAAYGASIWVTFVSSHVLARALPRQQFGVVQSRLYPVYFRALTYCIAAALPAHHLGRRRRTAAERVQGWNLMAVLGMVVLNMLCLEPKATRVMFERMKMEKEEGRGRDIVVESTPAAAADAAVAVARMDEEVKSRLGKLNRRLKKLNSYSSLLNVLALMGLTWHLVYVARCLQPSC